MWNKQIRAGLRGPEPPIARTTRSDELQLAWEIWTGSSWERVEVGDRDERLHQLRNGPLPFAGAGERLRVNGVLQPWIRVRIVAGEYGAPPVLHAVTVSYRVVTTKERPDRIWTYNDFWWEDQTAFKGFLSNRFVPTNAW